VEQIVAEGFGTTTHVRDDSAVGRGVHDGSGWSVAIGLPAAREGIGTPLEPGRQWQTAFAVWLGDQQNRGGRKHYANWIPFQLELP
jgi:DMSO reductase family type II enzyme heme b subunit